MRKHLRPWLLYDELDPQILCDAGIQTNCNRFNVSSNEMCEAFGACATAGSNTPMQRRIRVRSFLLHPVEAKRMVSHLPSICRPLLFFSSLLTPLVMRLIRYHALVS